VHYMTDSQPAPEYFLMRNYGITFPVMANF